MPPKQAPKTVKGILRHHGETTTVKGVPKLLKSRRLPVKLLWVFAVIFGGTIAIYQLTTLLIKFFSYSTTTSLTEVQEAPEFPDVTLCNLNPLTETLSRDVTPDDYSQALLHYSRGNMGTSNYQYYYDLLPTSNMTESELHDVSATIFSPSGYYQSFPFDVSNFDKEMQRTVQTVFTDCVFYSWDMTLLDLKCDETTIRVFFFPRYLVCFTLSVPEEYSTRVKGVSSIFYLHQDSHATFPIYQLNILEHKSNGLNLVVHPRNTLPALTEGDTIAPGHVTTIRINSAYVELLPEPYGECIDKTYLEFPDEYESRDGVRDPYLYTAASCKSNCYQNHVIDVCGCIDPIHGYTEDQLMKHKNIQFCGNTTFIEHNVEGLRLNVSKG